MVSVINYKNYEQEEFYVQPHGRTLFLSGSCQSNWRDDVISSVKANFDKSSKNFIIIDPFNPEWEELGEPNFDNKKFRRQVDFEYRTLTESQAVFVNFEKGTVAPISLFEFGTAIESSSFTVVVCDPQYEKYAHVKIYCAYNSIPFFARGDRSLS
jgi:hypothetical protein